MRIVVSDVWELGPILLVDPLSPISDILQRQISIASEHSRGIQRMRAIDLHYLEQIHLARQGNRFDWWIQLRHTTLRDIHWDFETACQSVTNVH